MSASSKILPKKNSFGSLIATLFAVSSTFVGLPVEAQQFCEAFNSASYGEPPAETRRTVELPSIGLAVAIPANYRTMQLQNGAIQIVHPSVFDMLQCLSRGGQGGHGFYFETIKLVEDDLTMDLREQATWLAGYSEQSDGSRVPLANQIIPYECNDLSGYIVTSAEGYGVSFLGSLPGRDSLLEVSAGCDCQVEINTITELLPNITMVD